MQEWLELPPRDDKPRRRGLTVAIDNGAATGWFRDVMQSHGRLVDYVKFGWGTAYVTADIGDKIAAAREHQVIPFLGGTFFEKAIHQGCLPRFLDYVRELGLDHIEVSNGSIAMENQQKAAYIAELKENGFTIFSEVGFKDQERSIELPPKKWIEYIGQDIEAGAERVITEARESGSSGICRKDGELRFGLIQEIIDSGHDMNRLIFESPNKTLQTYFIKHIGSQVNLGNIALGDLVALETLRLGLRADTLHEVKTTAYRR